MPVSFATDTYFCISSLQAANCSTLPLLNCASLVVGSCLRSTTQLSPCARPATSGIGRVDLEGPNDYKWKERDVHWEQDGIILTVVVLVALEDILHLHVQIVRVLLRVQRAPFA